LNQRLNILAQDKQTTVNLPAIAQYPHSKSCKNRTHKTYIGGINGDVTFSEQDGGPDRSAPLPPSPRGALLSSDGSDALRRLIELGLKPKK
jgi:hypothetical protein